jgi:AmmeMemoRadiSam system protein B
MSVIPDLRPSPIAGAWYAGNPEVLRKQVNHYLDEAELPTLQGEVLGVIAPHAGHRYSGRTAGYAFGAVRGASFDLVVIASPMHAFHSASLLTSAHAAYATPLGAVEIDRAALKTFAQKYSETTGLPLTAVARDPEHSLEIELPFLQCALANDFQLLPLMVRTHDARELKQIGHFLAETLHDRNVLLVASTDLSHFYPETLANELDRKMMAQFEAFSPEGVLQADASGKGFACGAGAVAVILWTAQELGAQRVQNLHHSTSADETGDTSSVVGYGAAVILK